MAVWSSRLAMDPITPNDCMFESAVFHAAPRQSGTWMQELCVQEWQNAEYSELLKKNAKKEKMSQKLYFQAVREELWGGCAVMHMLCKTFGCVLQSRIPMRTSCLR